MIPPDRRLRLLLLSSLLLLAACATGAEPLASGPAEEGAGRDRGLPAVARVPLITTRVDGVADSQVIPVRHEGRDAWLALDTGAPFTFLYRDEDAEEDFVEHAGTVWIEGEPWDLPGYGDDAIGVETFDGKPIVGVLGLDFFLEGPSAIDYPGGCLVRYLDGAVPVGDAALPRLPLTGTEHGRALVDVVIDDIEVTLMFDTGAHDTFWLGVRGNDEDEVSIVQTADGAQWEVFVGEGRIALPGEPVRSVPVMHAPSIGYVAAERAELGYDGLLGLTALGWRRIVVHSREGVIILGPRRP